MNLVKICQQVCEVAQQAGALIANQAGKVRAQDIEEKYLNNLVSYVDIEAEKLIVKGLKDIVPEAGFIAEEGTTERTEAPLQWIIDPLDGTTNFLYQIPSYAVSIALMQGEEIILGVVYEVNRQECFYAWKGGGAWLNKKAIKVSRNTALKNAIIATGFPYYDFSQVQQYLKVLEHFILNARSIRRLGAASVDLCYVAWGKFDSYYEHSLSAWDVAAGSIIVQEAGGVVNDFSGENNYLFGKEIVASSTAIHPICFPIVNQHLGTIKVSGDKIQETDIY